MKKCFNMVQQSVMKTMMTRMILLVFALFTGMAALFAQTSGRIGYTTRYGSGFSQGTMTATSPAAMGHSMTMSTSGSSTRMTSRPSMRSVAPMRSISPMAMATGSGNTGGSTGQAGTSPRTPRRVYGPGAETDGNGNYWDDDAEAWLPIPGEKPYIGETKIENGVEWTWNGSEWIRSASEVDSPIGDTPYLFLILLSIGVAIYRRSLYSL